MFVLGKLHQKKKCLSPTDALNKVIEQVFGMSLYFPWKLQLTSIWRPDVSV